MDTWGSLSCCTVAWGSADGLEKLKMKHDSNWPEASTDQIRQNNRRGSSSGAMENTGFCPWLGSDIAGGGGAASPSSLTASFLSPQVDCKVQMLPLCLEKISLEKLSAVRGSLMKNKSVGAAAGAEERAGKLSSGNTGWPRLRSAVPCRRLFSGMQRAKFLAQLLPLRWMDPRC